MIGINYLVLLYVRNISKQKPQRHKPANPELFKTRLRNYKGIRGCNSQPVITGDWPDIICEFCSWFQP